MASLRQIIFAAALCGALAAVQGSRMGRLVHGERTNIEDAPWLVQLVPLDSEGRVTSAPKCTGSIIDSKRILTSAHCFGDDPNPEKSVKVVVGAADLVDVETGEAMKVESVAIHPEYKGENQKYDLAVMHLAHDIEFNDRTQPIEVVSKPVEANTKVYGGGWGTVAPDINGPPVFPETLKTAEMIKMSRDWCDQFLQGVALTQENADALLCMQPVTGVPCSGDSGSAAWVPAHGDKPAQQFAVLQGGVTCEIEDAVPLYVDLLHKDVKDFLIENGVLKKSKAKAHLLNF